MAGRRQTKRIVRKPATKCPKIQKRIRKARPAARGRPPRP